MAFQADPSAGAPAVHVCPQCSKSFARLCDLNKHSKSHSRPYKCNDTSCKYNTLGWPTAKELERHINDKHSATPRTFPCLFQPCPYWSKRESNCKQHMEKAHDWKYVKSKSKGRRPPAQHKTGDSDYSPNNYAMAADADHGSSAISTSPQSFVAPPPGVDFVLFDDQEDALGDDDDPLYPHYGDCAESYLPWTSPMTRLRDNELLIERFSQTYNSMQENASTAASSSDAELDPGLSSFAFHGYPQADAHAPFVGDVAIKVESPVMTVDTAFPRKRKHEPVEVPSAHLEQAPTTASGVGPNRSRKAGTGQGAPTPSKARLASKCRDSSGEDGCRPKKKIKPNSTEDFTDTSMPDIFRHAHPDIYDRNRMDKYSPCHTVHREISTLVRHLSRPAHRLNVTERTISSFDIDDPDFRHPRVGVCRSCWQTFGDRSAFDAHLTRPCQRVSKGKREKWHVLFESFTPLCDSTDTAPSSAESTQQTEEQWERFSDHLDDSLVPDDDDDDEDVRTPSTSVPSPVPLQLAGFAPVDPGAGRFVSADEHDRLQREHEALRERHQQLERMTQALLIQRLFQENTKPTTAPAPDTKPPPSNSPKKTCPPTSPAASDRDSLFQHMDSQSTDVDVHAFMEEMEDTRQSLSRMNSGMSVASRSTIHRVPPSPPSRRAELPGAKTAADQPSHQAKTPLAHRPPPPSIPDSGYGTENRRGSLGDLPGQLATTTKPLTPPSTAEAEAKKPSEGMMPWNESPSPQRTPRANPSSSGLSPHHSQASQPSQPGGFLTEQEMADYDDASYNLFYDNMLHARASPPGFTF